MNKTDKDDGQSDDDEHDASAAVATVAALHGVFATGQDM